MDDQKIIKPIKSAIISLFLFGATTMSYAEHFHIKHIYSPIVQAPGIHSPTATIPVSYPIAISDDDYVIVGNLRSITSSIIDSDEFGIYKTPLSTDMRKRKNEVNKILGIPRIENVLATNNKNNDLAYTLDNESKQQKSEALRGFKVYSTWNTDEFLKYGKKSQVKSSQTISTFISDLEDLGESKDRVKFADFYGVTNIIPKKEGLEVDITFKNVGPFDVKFGNFKDIEDISKDQYYDRYNKKWYELRIGGVYKEEGLWFRIFLLPDFLIKDCLSSDEISNGTITVKSNSERIIKFLVPYKNIKAKPSSAKADINRTKEGYILLDHNAAIVQSNWNMRVSFGLFSEETWKEEKPVQIKDWVNLN